jgi:dTDP-4-dehydrorhamnose 3,5-epimerase
VTVFRPFSARTGKIGGLYFIEMKEAHEERGVVREFYRESAFADAGLPPLGPWLQVNVTETVQGALRGLHGENMYKLVAVVAGEAFGAYVDVRPDSPTRGCVETLELVAGMQVLVPHGVCNGFQSVSPGTTQYLYTFDAEWAPGMAGAAVNPLDPALGIAWPLPVDPGDPASLSVKDRGLPTLAEVLGPAGGARDLEH